MALAGQIFFFSMAYKVWGLSWVLFLGASAVSPPDVGASAQSRCSVTGAMYLADGSQFLNFSKARGFLIGSPQAACAAALDGLRQGLSLTSDQAGLRLCLVEGSSGKTCVRDVARLKQGIDANNVLSLVAGQSVQSVRLETSAHLYVRPKAGL